jgi:hypothetical protein
MKSKKKEAVEIQEWITNDVMPSIRKYGQYKLDSNIKKQLDALNILLEKYKNENKILKHNLKNPKKGKVVYLLRSIETTIKLDKSETLFVKFGRTKNMKTRKANYDTAHKNRVQVLKTINVDDAKIIEDCVINKMEDYKISDGKEYFDQGVASLHCQAVLFLSGRGLHLYVHGLGGGWGVAAFDRLEKKGEPRQGHSMRPCNDAVLYCRSDRGARVSARARYNP